MTVGWTPTSYRIAGLAAVLGGILWIVPVGAIGWLLPVTPSVAGPLGVTVPSALTIVGVLAIRARYGDRLGEEGLYASRALLVGLAIVAVAALVVFAELPAEPAAIDLGSPLWIALFANLFGLLFQAVGAFALGVLLWTRDLGPKAGSGLLVAQLLTFFVGGAFGVVGLGGLGAALDAVLTLVAFGAAWIVYGYHFLATADEAG